MIDRKLIREIRAQRNIYLFGLIDEFKSSKEEEKGLFNCYEYVKTSVNFGIEDFYNTLSSDVKDIVSSNHDGWFIPIESPATFSIFLDNNDIKII